MKNAIKEFGDFSNTIWKRKRLETGNRCSSSQPQRSKKIKLTQDGDNPTSFRKTS